MSTFRKFTTSPTGDQTILISNIPLHSDPGVVRINTIAITNNDTVLDDCDVEIFVELTSGDTYTVMKVNIPQKATAVYDVPFSIMESGNLKINTSNNSIITVIIN